MAKPVRQHTLLLAIAALAGPAGCLISVGCGNKTSDSTSEATAPPTSVASNVNPAMKVQAAHQADIGSRQQQLMQEQMRLQAARQKERPK